MLLRLPVLDFAEIHYVPPLLPGYQLRWSRKIGQDAKVYFTV